MKKHNKDVLKATLFALIAIFIMIGAAGLLFAEHKKKIQKEQQSDTDSSGYSYAHTGAYSHSDTDSSDYQGTGVHG